jgi:hypothetical protein
MARTTRTLADPASKAYIAARIGTLTPRSPRRWGKMSVNQMLCHLADSYRSVIGERGVSPAKHWLPLPILKWFALRVPLRWPPNMPTRPENEQGVGGTPPAEFESDRRELIAALERFCSVPDSARSPHPLFGALTHEEWMIWGFLHADHHLRQFNA